MNSDGYGMVIVVVVVLVADKTRVKCGGGEGVCLGVCLPDERAWPLAGGSGVTPQWRRGGSPGESAEEGGVVID